MKITLEFTNQHMKKNEKKILIEKILFKIKPDVKKNYNNNLINDGIIDSFDIVRIISEIETSTGNIKKNMIKRSTFSSIDNMMKLIK